MKRRVVLLPSPDVVMFGRRGQPFVLLFYSAIHTRSTSVKKVTKNLKAVAILSRPGFILFGLMIIACLSPGRAFAGMILNAELKLTYEDNVVGLLSDQQRGQSASGGGMPGVMLAPGMGGMGGGNTRYTGAGSSTQSPGDFSATLSAEAGGYQSVGKSSEVFAKGFADHTSYSTYTDLDATIAGVTTGINMGLSNAISARFAILGKVKRFGDSQRDSTSYGGNVSLKEKLDPVLWIREFGEYEKNNADTSTFSYSGTTIGVSAGYSLSRNTIASVGYSYLVERYNEPSGAEIHTNSLFLSAEHTLRKSWIVAGEYDLQISKVTATGTNNTDNIFSVALRYSY
jgi:hypothetical protein